MHYFVAVLFHNRGARFELYGLQNLNFATLQIHLDKSEPAVAIYTFVNTRLYLEQEFLVQRTTDLYNKTKNHMYVLMSRVIVYDVTRIKCRCSLMPAESTILRVKAHKYASHATTLAVSAACTAPNAATVAALHSAPPCVYLLISPVFELLNVMPRICSP